MGSTPAPRCPLSSWLAPQPVLLQFSPGPIYAVDGDWAINEKISYSLQGGEWRPSLTPFLP